MNSTPVLSVRVDSATSNFLAQKGFMITEDQDPTPEGLCRSVETEGAQAVLFGMQSPLGNESVSIMRRNSVTVPVVRIFPGPRDRAWALGAADFLDAGGDDMIEGPAQPEVVNACLRAAIRKARVEPDHEVTLRCDGVTVTVNLSTGWVYRNGRRMNMTSHEMVVLRALTETEGVCTRDCLSNALYGLDKDAHQSNTIEVFVTRIRSKLGPYFVETRRTQGYELVGRVI